jgi:alginate O-acetyltransferase complex protein AlgI
VLFNSYIFIIFFLPITFVLVLLAKRLLNNSAAEITLLGASAVFYSWSGIWNLALLGTLAFLNYAAALHLMRTKLDKVYQRNLVLTLGVVLNIGVLGYFKYRGFFLENIHLAPSGTAAHVIIPLAISFFTFQKIAFLVECSRGEVRYCSFPRYLMFVAFFPQLIAGPIVRFGEVGLQFDDIIPIGQTSRNLAIGSTLFIIGLFKKLVIADGLGAEVDKLFPLFAAGDVTGTLPAWSAALLYTFQLYFDFSGYCDMAIGLARMFGIKLPLNFFSPYKATSIIEFWRRWHITLSRFLRDFLYVPLGGNRKGWRRRYLNLMITMSIGGLWHGAGWTFVFWGVLHGLYLCTNHLWRALPFVPKLRWLPQPVRSLVGWAITFLAVVVAWVFFRAPDFATALAIIENMCVAKAASASFSIPDHTLVLFALAVFVALIMPNAYQWLRDRDPALHFEDRPEEILLFLRFARWQPSLFSLLLILTMACWALSQLDENREFIYFRF